MLIPQPYLLFPGDVTDPLHEILFFVPKETRLHDGSKNALSVHFRTVGLQPLKGTREVGVKPHYMLIFQTEEDVLAVLRVLHAAR